jgi:hypothetical protein
MLVEDVCLSRQATFTWVPQFDPLAVDAQLAITTSPPPQTMSALPATISVTVKLPVATSDDAKEPAPAAAAAELDAALESATMLDLAFCCDCTASMGSYIRSAQENILRITNDIHSRCNAKCDLQYALVKYRDHPPQDRSFITQTLEFTADVQQMKAAVDTMKAQGGGDGPEAVAAALHAVNELKWRPNATKVVVLIADAPPHGLGEQGDGFPNGCPQGHDPIGLCKTMAAKGIVIYAVGVEPVISTSYKFARDFMMAVAKITEGKFLPLGQAQILSDVIVAGAVEGMEMEALWNDLQTKVAAEAAAEGENLGEDDMITRVSDRLAKQKVQMQAVEVSNPYMDDYDDSNVDALMNATNLREGQSRMRSSVNAQAAQKSAGYAWAQQEQQCAQQPMSMQQQTRMVSKAKKKSAF